MGGSAAYGPATRIVVSSVAVSGLQNFFTALEAMPFKGSAEPTHLLRFVFSAADEWDEGASTTPLPSGKSG